MWLEEGYAVILEGSFELIMTFQQEVTALSRDNGYSAWLSLQF